ncbi:MAG TPA: hypothetical protein PKJ14_01145 [Candidatus Cloacimonadota bacterium]|nr:hypothetical protein [Candidatus Cloacimonadota bacterium]HQL15437.1 hypothetical protein [Candidatus Cloacimonadota bacterium]
MSKRWMEILLIVSLAFNLAVLGMFIYSTVFHKSSCPPPEPQWRAENHPFQSHRFDPDSVLQNKEEIRQLRQAFQESRQAFMATLAKSELNLQEAKQAMEKSLQAQEKLERRLGESLIQVRTKMTADEAKRFFEHRMKRIQRSPQPNPANPSTKNKSDETQSQGEQK